MIIVTLGFELTNFALWNQRSTFFANASSSFFEVIIPIYLIWTYILFLIFYNKINYINSDAMIKWLFQFLSSTMNQFILF